MNTNTTRTNPTTTTPTRDRAWRRLFPTYAEHGVTRTMCPVEVRIVRDVEWDEYRCELWTDGAHRFNADYHTDDLKFVNSDAGVVALNPLYECLWRCTSANGIERQQQRQNGSEEH